MLDSLMVWTAQCCSQSTAVKYSFPMWSRNNWAENIKLQLQLFGFPKRIIVSLLNWTFTENHIFLFPSQMLLAILATANHKFPPCSSAGPPAYKLQPQHPLANVFTPSSPNTAIQFDSRTVNTWCLVTTFVLLLNIKNNTFNACFRN